jgi:hypothetical protein
MFIIVQHEISNPQEFWGAAQRELPNLPEGIKIHASYPNETMDRATCLWECASVEGLRAYLEDKTGRYSKNVYTAVNAANAIGLPK